MTTSKQTTTTSKDLKVLINERKKYVQEFNNDKIKHNIADPKYHHLFTVTDKSKVTFLRTDIAAFIIDKFNILVAPRKKYIYVYNSDEGIYEIDYGSFVKSQLNDMFGDYININETKEILNKLFNHPRFQFKDIDTVWCDTRYICCNNGVYDIEEKKLFPHSPKYYFLNKIPVNFVENATCPNLDKLMSNVFDEDQIKQEYEWIGYCLTAGQRYKLISFYIGNTDSGKSTYFRVLEHLFGSKNTTSVEPQEIGKNYNTYQFHNKMLNICADVGTHKIRNFNKIKMLSGNDTITAREIYQETINFINSAKMMWAANRMPPTDDTTTASYNRIRQINCTKFITKKDIKNFKFANHITDEEMSGLLCKAIKGLHTLDERGHFELPTMNDRILNQEISENSIFMWGDDSLNFTNNRDDRIFGVDLVESYKAWMKKNNQTLEINERQFVIDFKKSFYKNYIKYSNMRIKGTQGNGCQGVKWTEEKILDDLELDDVTDDVWELYIEE